MTILTDQCEPRKDRRKLTKQLAACERQLKWAIAELKAKENPRPGRIQYIEITQ